jgi:putative glutamine amidotransferase
MKPIIGITCRTIKNDDRDILKVNKSIVDYVIKSGGIPLLILSDMDFSIFDGFIFPGGYSWENLDEKILKYAFDNDIPALGICAGMQLIASMDKFGNVLDNCIAIGNNHHQSKDEYVHEITINKGILLDILGSNKIIVNSRHNDTVNLNDNFLIDAYSSDNIIEAVHIPNKTFILGLQWHPEDLSDEYSEKIFKYFIEKCKK